MLDDLDRRILRLLQSDPTLGVPELARTARSTPAKVTRRLDRMHDDGVILNSEAVINWTALGYAVAVSLRITLDKTQPRAFDDFLAAAVTDIVRVAVHDADPNLSVTLQWLLRRDSEIIQY